MLHLYLTVSLLLLAALSTIAASVPADLSDYVTGVGRVRTETTDKPDDMLILIDPVSLLGE